MAVYAHVLPPSLYFRLSGLRMGSIAEMADEWSSSSKSRRIMYSTRVLTLKRMMCTGVVKKRKADCYNT